MFINNLDPVLVNLGPLQIRYYGLVYAFGFILAMLILVNLAKRKEIKGFDVEKAYDLTLIIILSSIIGARLFFELVYNFQSFINYPLQFFYFWQGGMSIHGGLLFGVLGVYYFCRKNKIHFYDVGDLLVMPLALMLFFGRIANFINGELYGKVTNVSWAVKFRGVEGYRHPSQLYEALKNIIIFFTLAWMKTFKLRKGTIFWSFICLYGFLRFLVTFYREAEYYFLEIGIGQWISLLMVPIAGVMIYMIYKK